MFFLLEGKRQNLNKTHFSVYCSLFFYRVNFNLIFYNFNVALSKFETLISLTLLNSIYNESISQINKWYNNYTLELMFIHHEISPIFTLFFLLKKNLVISNGDRQSVSMKMKGEEESPGGEGGNPTVWSVNAFTKV